MSSATDLNVESLSIQMKTSDAARRNFESSSLFKKTSEAAMTLRNNDNSSLLKKPSNGLSSDYSPDLDQIEVVKGLQEKSGGEKKSSEEDDGWSTAPENPLNWTNGRKWKNVLIVSFYTFVSPLASSMTAPALPVISDHFHITNPTIIALTLSIFLLAYALGPLVISPLSEIYGRLWVLHISNIVFVIFCTASIFAPNTAALILFRFFAGLGGSTPAAIGGSVVGDMFVGEARGTAMSVYSLGPLVGPGLGPIIARLGGFVVQTIGFKWIFILLALCGASASVVGIPLFDETYGPVVRHRYLASRFEDIENGGTERPSPASQPKQSVYDTLRANISRPFVLLTRSLICFMLSIYMALIYGYFYLLFTTFPDLFSRIYGWSPGLSGLAYLGAGIGFIAATLIGAPLLSRSYMILTERNNGVSKPEFRIPVMFLGSILVPAGLFWYGWSAQARLIWIMPIIGTALFASPGAGQMFVFIPLQLYLVDSFTYSASALGAASVLRALFGFAFPLFGEQMFAALGFGGGNSLLAGLAILTGVPFPIFLWFKGEEIRLRNPLNR